MLIDITVLKTNKLCKLLLHISSKINVYERTCQVSNSASGSVPVVWCESNSIYHHSKYILVSKGSALMLFYISWTYRQNWKTLEICLSYLKTITDDEVNVLFFRLVWKYSLGRFWVFSYILYLKSNASRVCLLN